MPAVVGGPSVLGSPRPNGGEHGINGPHGVEGCLLRERDSHGVLLHLQRPRLCALTRLWYGVFDVACNGSSRAT